jgi:hypothetical protein
MGRESRRVNAAPRREKAMWILELNIAGHQFTREMSDLRRRPAWFIRRNTHSPVLRQSHAA